MIAKERAVKLVEALLAEERLTWPAPVRELAICDVEEHAVGWLVFWNSAEYARTGAMGARLVGSGPYLVDGSDGSIYHVPAVTWLTEDWQELYLRQIKGVRRLDPLAASVRSLANSAGAVAAMTHLRKQAPRLSPSAAKDYVMAVRNGAEPPEELARLTRAEQSCVRHFIETLTGPVL
ncbi:YrhB domain-containing protein [Kitasatospora sp. NPDC006697]|uniref:YrhB domain-containing protein n=1 Tax=Kitasatospora sp. NPDC006697 TaxID=3364020 RepID=UPI0036B92700